MQNQTLFLKKLALYLEIMSKNNPQYREKNVRIYTSLLNGVGYCSGILALWFYYKRKNNLQYFYENIINPILSWNGTKESLTPELKDRMEYALNTVSWLQSAYLPFKQATSGMIHPETKSASIIQQSDYDVLLEVIKQKNDVILRKEYEIAFVFTNPELQAILQSISTDKSIRLSSSDHVIGLEYDNNTQEYILFDPNGFIDKTTQEDFSEQSKNKIKDFLSKSIQFADKTAKERFFEKIFSENKIEDLIKKVQLLDEATKERFFEKRFSKDKIEDLIKNIQQAFLYQPGSDLTGICISVFDEIQKPLPVYVNRVKKIKQILEARHASGKSIPIDQGATYDDASPLCLTAMWGHQDSAEFLLTQGTQINQKIKKGASIISVTAENGHTSILKILLDPVSPAIAEKLIKEPMQSNGLTPLHIAAANGNIETVKFLLSKGAKIDTQTQLDITGWIGSPLRDAIRAGHLQVVELLLNTEEGQKLINFQTRYIPPLLYIATEYGQLDIADLLLSKGAKLEIIKKSDTVRMNQNTPAREDYMNPLHVAIINGDLAMVKLLLSTTENQALLDIPTQNNHYTPLMLAGSQEIKILKLLLEKKGNKPEDIKTALKFAISEKKTEVIHWLIHLLIQKNAVDKTIIQDASQDDDTTILVMLLNSSNAQTFINEPDKNGNTLLGLATQKQLLNNVQLLLHKGATVDLKAIHSAHTAILEILLNTPSGTALINEPNEKGDTLLNLTYGQDTQLLLNKGAIVDLKTIHDAISMNDRIKLEILLNTPDGRALINEPDENGDTSLSLAAKTGSVDNFELLLQNGSTINSKAIHSAAKNDNSIKLEILLNTPEGRALINDPDEHGNTPLDVAAIQNFEFLLKNGATINSRAIHFAARRKTPQLLEDFLNNYNGRALINEPDEDGNTALNIATTPQNVQILLKHGATINTKIIHSAAHTNDSAILEILLDTPNGRALINEPNRRETALSIAVRRELAQNVHILLKNGATINSKLIRLASQQNDSTILKRLLDALPNGSDLINEPDDEENTPLHLAIEKGLPENIELLLNKGAIIDPKAIEYASQREDSAILKILLDATAHPEFSIHVTTDSNKPPKMKK